MAADRRSDNPGAWLTAAAKHRAIDQFRRKRLAERKHEQLGQELQAGSDMPDFDAALDDDIGRTCCGCLHGMPSVLSPRRALPHVAAHGAG